MYRWVPPEILIKIGESTPVSDLLSCRRTCKAWKEAIEDEPCIDMHSISILRSKLKIVEPKRRWKRAKRELKAARYIMDKTTFDRHADFMRIVSSPTFNAHAAAFVIRNVPRDSTWTTGMWDDVLNPSFHQIIVARWRAAVAELPPEFATMWAWFPGAMCSTRLSAVSNSMDMLAKEDSEGMEIYRHSVWFLYGREFCCDIEVNVGGVVIHVSLECSELDDDYVPHDSGTWYYDDSLMEGYVHNGIGMRRYEIYTHLDIYKLEWTDLKSAIFDSEHAPLFARKRHDGGRRHHKTYDGLRWIFLKIWQRVFQIGKFPTKLLHHDDMFRVMDIMVSSVYKDAPYKNPYLTDSDDEESHKRPRSLSDSDSCSDEEPPLKRARYH